MSEAIQIMNTASDIMGLLVRELKIPRQEVEKIRDRLAGMVAIAFRNNQDRWTLVTDALPDENTSVPVTDGMIKMELDEYIGLIFDELQRAERKIQGFPTDPVHAAAILTEKVGELRQACLQWAYEGGSLGDITKEAVQFAAMALRFLFNVKSLRQRTTNKW